MEAHLPPMGMLVLVGSVGLLAAIACVVTALAEYRARTRHAPPKAPGPTRQRVDGGGVVKLAGRVARRRALHRDELASGQAPKGAA